MSIQDPSSQGSTAPADTRLTFKQMSAGEKCAHLLKLVIFICTFGFAFPHAMDAFLS
jgi:hypothetical protein